MKKSIIAICIVIASLSASAQQKPAPQKPAPTQQADTTRPRMFFVGGSVQDWETIVQIMRQSSAPHTTVESALRFIVEQVNRQLADTTGKK